MTLLLLSEAADRLRARIKASWLGWAIPVVLFCLWAILLYVALHMDAHALSPTVEERYCFEPATVPRDADGKIARNRAVIAFFRARHPCPSSKLTSGPCAGWAIDHVIPLECGGCDSVNNMQWLPNGIKSAAGPLPKDRWERAVYCPKP